MTNAIPVQITCGGCGDTFDSYYEPDEHESATFECPKCGELVDLDGFVYSSTYKDFVK